jgi:hypothetical protein
MPLNIISWGLELSRCELVLLNYVVDLGEHVVPPFLNPRADTPLFVLFHIPLFFETTTRVSILVFLSMALLAPLAAPMTRGGGLNTAKGTKTGYLKPVAVGTTRDEGRPTATGFNGLLALYRFRGGCYAC